MVPEDLYERIQETKHFLYDQGIREAQVGLILGSGMDVLLDAIEVKIAIPYHQIPHLTKTSVVSHKGLLIYGQMAGKPVIVFSGRIHYYEGYEMWQVAYPVRIMAALGVPMMITTGAAGGLNPEYGAGDIVVIKDHLSMMPENPLRGPNDERLGVRFPDMSGVYDRTLRLRMRTLLAEANLPEHEGTYLGLPGPSLETLAEYTFFHHAGADLVGMSIVPEVIVAAHSGLRVTALAVVSNVCYPPEKVTPTTAEDVVREVHTAGEKLKSILHRFLLDDNSVNF